MGGGTDVVVVWHHRGTGPGPNLNPNLRFLEVFDVKITDFDLF